MKIKPGYTIRQVIELTGVTEFTLRGWENRYRAFKPVRTDSGRRLYTQDDILRVKALQDLIHRGHKISQIASMTLPQLQKLVEDRELITATPVKSETKEDFEPIILLADQFKWDELHNLIQKKREKLKPLQFVRQFIVPLISEMSHQVDKGSLSIAQEHILSAIVRENLNLLRSQAPRGKSKTKIVFATPEGDLHEIGLLVASTLAALQGVHILYLGTQMPKRDLCETCIRYQATHVVVVSTVSKKEGATEELLEYLNFLDRHLVKKTAVWIAGRNTRHLDLNLRRDFKILKAFDEFEVLLGEVNK